MLQELLWLALAGGAGTLCRYGLAGLVQSGLAARFPWGTLAVNSFGCLLFGLVWGLAEERLVISGQTRFVVLTGFMGAFTTFSTFGFETTELLRDAQWTLAAVNLLANNGAGVMCVFLGFAASRFL